MSDPMTETPAPRRRRWLVPLLVVSLALNLLVAGAILGRSFSPEAHRGKDRVAGPLRSVVGEPFVRALSREDRQALLADIRREGPRIRKNRESLRDQVEAFLAALRSDPFEPDVVRRLLEDQRSVAQSRQELGEVLLLNRLSAMSDDERAAYADRLEKGLKNLRRR